MFTVEGGCTYEGDPVADGDGDGETTDDSGVIDSEADKIELSTMVLGSTTIVSFAFLPPDEIGASSCGCLCSSGKLTRTRAVSFSLILLPLDGRDSLGHCQKSKAQRDSSSTDSHGVMMCLMFIQRGRDAQKRK